MLSVIVIRIYYEVLIKSLLICGSVFDNFGFLVLLLGLCIASLLFLTEGFSIKITK